MNRIKFGIALDIDGVLKRTPHIIPQAPAALKKLCDKRIPFVLMTNSGGYHEEKKALQYSKDFNVPISASQVCLSHSPIREYFQQDEQGLLLLVGKKDEDLKSIGRAYGFKNFVTIDDYHAQFPELYPDIVPEPAPRVEAWHEPVKAVIILSDPYYWGRELQICIDVLTSQGRPGTTAFQQKVQLISSCADLFYSTTFPVHRFGSGSFRYCLEALYYECTGSQVLCVHFGKPHLIQFQYVERMLDQLNQNNGNNEKLSRFYMIGDNPETDIRGANNAGKNWRSVLVKTGIYKHEKTKLQNILPTIITDDVSTAIDEILEQEGL